MSESSSSTTSDNSANPVPEVPDLDQIISQITANGEFQEMMNNLSDGLKSVEGSQPAVNNEVAEEENLDTNKNINTESCVSGPVEHTSNYDICATFFADEDGNNICESLHGVQKSLDGINENLTKLVTIMSPSTDSSVSQ